MISPPSSNTLYLGPNVAAALIALPVPACNRAVQGLTFIIDLENLGLSCLTTKPQLPDVIRALPLARHPARTLALIAPTCLLSSMERRISMYRT